MEKHNFFLVNIEYIYILKDFKSHIAKIKFSSNIYIVNYEMSW
jgi:hypothetical protein